MPVYTLRYVVFDRCSHNYSIMYQKRNVREGNIGKTGAPGGENSLTGGCSGHCPGRAGNLGLGPASFVAPEAPQRTLCPVSGSGAFTKARLVKDRVRGKKPIGAIPSTSRVMPEDQNMTCGGMPNSRWNQPKKNGHLLSSELDYHR